MQVKSRESLQTVRQWFEAQLRDEDEAELFVLGDELSSVVALLKTQRVLRRNLADSSTSQEGRDSLVGELFSGRIGPKSVETVRKVTAARWSRSADLLDALELLGRLPLLVLAERAGITDEIEDELFRFSRILGSEPRLESLLADDSQPAQQRDRLLDDLLDGKVRRVSRELLAQLIHAPRGRKLHELIAEVVELAASQREESIAHVTAAAPLTEQQEQRLERVLSEIYGRRVSVRVDVDPGVRGGLVIRIGNEIIDGSTAGKLAKARQELLG